MAELNIEEDTEEYEKFIPSKEGNNHINMLEVNSGLRTTSKKLKKNDSC